MDGLLSKKVLDLALAMEEDPDVILLKEQEAALKQDPALLKLVEEKDRALSDYMIARMDYGEDSPEAKKAQQALHQAKMALDLQPKFQAKPSVPPNRRYPFWPLPREQALWGRT